jgi:hypothetical protein
VAGVARGTLYLWAGPTTVLGLAVAGLSWATGGSMAWVAGVLEVWGGAARIVLQVANSRAMTLGHVVLGRDRFALRVTRAHERAHVRQAEHWGPLFIPAYLAASVWAALRGENYYHGNWFEIDAERRAALGDPAVGGGGGC